MESKCIKCSETVILVLRESRFRVNKQQLMTKSYYFAALLSTNYSDHLKREHAINYTISSSTMQLFVDWINDDSEEQSDDRSMIKPCLMTLITNSKYLMRLLQLSVLFVADNLTKNLTSLIEAYWLSPHCIIDIWLLAEDLCIHVLRDICLSACLDRFNELSENSLINLPKYYILKLIKNNNVRCSKSKLKRIVMLWQKKHTSLPDDIMEKKPQNFLHSISSSTVSAKYRGENIKDVYENYNVYIHCWRNDNLFEFTDFLYPTDITDYGVIMGMQTTGRGLNVYIVGGEFGIGTERFQRKVWRYSLISKQWFCEGIMPIPRRHMVTVIVKTKLILVGGVGKYRMKLQSVDVFDVHKRTWDEGARLPVSFTEVPPHGLCDEKLVIIQSAICVYYMKHNVWLTIRLVADPPNLLKTPVVSFRTAMCYIEFTEDGVLLNTLAKYVSDLTNIPITEDSVAKCNSRKCFEFHLYTYHFFNRDRDILYWTVMPGHTRLFLLDDRIMGRQTIPFHLHTAWLSEPEKFTSILSSHTSFFRLIDPCDLHTMSSEMK